jgi:hypothetical protein
MHIALRQREGSPERAEKGEDSFNLGSVATVIGTVGGAIPSLLYTYRKDGASRFSEKEVVGVALFSPRRKSSPECMYIRVRNLIPETKYQFIPECLISHGSIVPNVASSMNGSKRHELSRPIFVAQRTFSVTSRVVTTVLRYLASHTLPKTLSTFVSNSLSPYNLMAATEPLMSNQNDSSPGAMASVVGLMSSA